MRFVYFAQVAAAAVAFLPFLHAVQAATPAIALHECDIDYEKEARCFCDRVGNVEGHYCNPVDPLHVYRCGCNPCRIRCDDYAFCASPGRVSPCYRGECAFRPEAFHELCAQCGEEGTFCAPCETGDTRNIWHCRNKKALQCPFGTRCVQKTQCHAVCEVVDCDEVCGRDGWDHEGGRCCHREGWEGERCCHRRRRHGRCCHEPHRFYDINHDRKCCRRRRCHRRRGDRRGVELCNVRPYVEPCCFTTTSTVTNCTSTVLDPNATTTLTACCTTNSVIATVTVSVTDLFITTIDEGTVTLTQTCTPVTTVETVTTTTTLCIPTTIVLEVGPIPPAAAPAPTPSVASASASLDTKKKRRDE